MWRIIASGDCYWILKPSLTRTSKLFEFVYQQKRATLNGMYLSRSEILLILRTAEAVTLTFFFSNVMEKYFSCKSNIKGAALQ